MFIIFKLIGWLVVFVVGYLFFSIVRLLALPLWNKVGIPALPPFPLTRGLWTSLTSILIYILAFVIFIVGLIALIWFFVIPILPNFPLPLRLIVQKIPPFPQFKQAGVFTLISDTAKVFYMKGTIKDRVLQLFIALGRFLDKSGVYILDAVHSIIGPNKQVDDLVLKRQISTSNAPEENKNEDDAPKISKEDRLRIRDEFQQCMEERIMPVYLDDTPLDRAKAMLNNNTAEAICQSRQFKTHLNMMSFDLIN